jgi:hypothetical protein
MGTGRSSPALLSEKGVSSPVDSIFSSRYDRRWGHDRSSSSGRGGANTEPGLRR